MDFGRPIYGWLRPLHSLHARQQRLDTPVKRNGVMRNALTKGLYRFNGQGQQALAVAIEDLGGAYAAALPDLATAGDMADAGEPQRSMLPFLSRSKPPAIAMRLERKSREAFE